MNHVQQPADGFAQVRDLLARPRAFVPTRGGCTAKLLASRAVARRTLARHVRGQQSVQAVVLVRLSVDADPVHFAQQLAALPEVAGAASLAGGHDLLLRVRCADLLGLDRLVRRLHAAGASRTRTRLVLGSVADFETGEFEETCLAVLAGSLVTRRR